MGKTDSRGDKNTPHTSKSIKDLDCSSDFATPCAFEKYGKERARIIQKFNKQKAWQTIQAATVEKPSRFKTYFRLVGATAAAAAMVFGVYQFVSPTTNDTQLLAEESMPLESISNYPTLTTSSGKSVVLSMDSLFRNSEPRLSFVDNTVAYEDLVDTIVQPEMHHIRVPFGQTLRLELEDGTMVCLNANTTLAFQSPFSDDSRDIEIIGEGYFEVTHDVSRPFRVKSGDFDVTVLGTKFAIKNYPADHNGYTTLAEGKVEVSCAGAHKILRPNQQCIIQQDVHSLSVVKVDAKQLVAWAHGQFSYRDVALKEILNDFGRYWNLDIVYESDSAQDECYSLRLERDQSLEDIIEAINKIEGVHIDQEGNQLVVK